MSRSGLWLSARVLLLMLAIGGTTGLAGAFFLWALFAVTDARDANEGLVWLLPVAGALIGAFYERWGRASVAGTSLVVEALHTPTLRLPKTFAPIAVLATVASHAFGASVGREGSALQLGAGVADLATRPFALTAPARRALLVAGVAAGFGAVFGTPLAGAVFAVELLGRGARRLRLLPLAVVCAVVADATSRAVGSSHVQLPELSWPAFSWALALGLVVFALALALLLRAFLGALRGLQAWTAARIPSRPRRLAVGGAVVVALWLVVGSSAYLGLGVPAIEASFLGAPEDPWAFAWKCLLTVVSVGFGFPGGEVTPLFFMGATLGSALADAAHLPVALFAGVGMFALFGAASRAPLALSVMAMETLGVVAGPFVLVVSVATMALGGGRGLYDRTGSAPDDESVSEYEEHGT